MRNPLFILFLVLLGVVSPARAQRRVTPVDPLATPQVTVETDTVAVTEEEPEKPKVKGHIHPLWNGLQVSVNVMDGIANLFGQSYGNYELAVELDLYNRFFPVWEIGVGRADNTPEGLNFTYRTRASLYNRVGMNYNFKYNDESKSFFYIGLRYGFSFFSYNIDDITITDPYWQESETLSIAHQKSWAHWGELLGGVRVQVCKNFYMGWTARYHYLFGSKENESSTLWFIPGYGTESSPFGFTYTLGYRFSLGGGKKREAQQPVIE